MRLEWEAAHTVTEELVQGPPSRRANATLTPCPNGNHLWSIGGEYFSDDGKAVRIVSAPAIPPDPPPLSTFTMTCFATLPTRCVSERSKLMSHRMKCRPRRTNGANSFPKPARVPVLHTASSRLPQEAANSISLVRSLSFGHPACY